jgi:hypothetical protein
VKLLVLLTSCNQLAPASPRHGWNSAHAEGACGAALKPAGACQLGGRCGQHFLCAGENGEGVSRGRSELHDAAGWLDVHGCEGDTKYATEADAYA